MKWTQKTVPGCQRLLAEKKMMNTLRLNYCGDYEEENVTMMVDDDLPTMTGTGTPTGVTITTTIDCEARW